MSKPKILLVDDVNLLLELQKSFLRASDVTVITARNGKEALALIEAERPNLIFMDINMPVMDGITCCRRIKQDPDIASIPVVMVTTAGSAEDVEICRQAGCNDYITKPIDRRLFLDMGRKYLPPVDRREPRVPAKGAVSFSVDGRSIQGEVVDLSIGGAYIASVSCLRQEDRITLTLTLNDEEPCTIKARGRVAWENRGGLPSKAHLPEGFGVEFLDLDALSRELLIQYVEARKPS